MERVPIPKNPELFDRVISDIQKGLADNLPWLDHSFGRAERLVKSINGKKYYFDPETAIMYKNCTIKINGKSYTFDANGVYITAAATNKRK